MNTEIIIGSFALIVLLASVGISKAIGLQASEMHEYIRKGPKKPKDIKRPII
jgi:hypothetical protein